MEVCLLSSPGPGPSPSPKFGPKADTLESQELYNLLLLHHPTSTINSMIVNSCTECIILRSCLDSHIHHTMMMSVTRSSAPGTGDCLTSGPGLHADTGSGCQVRLVSNVSNVRHIIKPQSKSHCPCSKRRDLD